MNTDLYTINTQLMELERLMGAYRLRIANKEEEWRRLKEALTDLGNNKNDFIEMKWICLKPEFSSKILHGDNANNLNVFKEDALQASFIAISNEQISDAEVKISKQMEIVQQEIGGIGSSISSLETQHAKWTAQKLEVKSQS